ncbi:hypothetical protein J437_LFUL000226 [Ladona fulva]|uniref:Uncharacterized protein n=1 Tax=Ladona fulva TaxID=123851 RepID=A0A8K0JUK5_LADFU|nr:hypothetical protein J437_LFUL000226 [Ladona fulva]
MNGIILVSWRRKVLERQVSYGAKLGHVNLRVARMELRYFYRHTVSVAEYFDHQHMLIAVDGERDPSEVYTDFRSAVTRLLENSESTMPTMERPPGALEALETGTDANSTQPKEISVAVETHQPSRTRYPPVIWGVLGATKHLCAKELFARQVPLLLPNDKRFRQAISSGEMAPQENVEAIIESEMERGVREGARAATWKGTSGRLCSGIPSQATTVQGTDFADAQIFRPSKSSYNSEYCNKNEIYGL